METGNCSNAPHAHISVAMGAHVSLLIASISNAPLCAPLDDGQFALEPCESFCSGARVISIAMHFWLVR